MLNLPSSHLPRHGSLIAIAVVLVAIRSLSDAIYVAPNGDDAHPGTLDRPMKTIQKAADTVISSTTTPPQEIVLREGIYRGGVSIGKSADDRNPIPALLIRAETGTNGNYVNAIIDGSVPVKDAAEVAGAPGVYKLTIESVTASTPGAKKISQLCVWEEEARIRYKDVSTPDAVRLIPGSSFWKGDTVFFHTSDNRSCSNHTIRLSRDCLGIEINRPGVTIRGLQFRHFLRSASSCGIGTRSHDIRIEDCRFWNCWRGITLGSFCTNQSVLRCRFDDVGGGIKSGGSNVTIQQCQIFRRPGPFEVPEYSQDQTAIQCYYPACGGIIRSNLCVGFWGGIYIKCDPSPFVVEHNTVVGTLPDHKFGIVGSGQTGGWAEGLVCRYNIVTGYPIPLMLYCDIISSNAVVDNNIFWHAKQAKEIRDVIMRLGCGTNNCFDNPQYVDPENDDYRASAVSSTDSVSVGKIIPGAVGVKNLPPFNTIQPVKDAVLRDTQGSGKPAAPIIPQFIRREGPSRSWHVDSRMGSDAGDGSQKQPFQSLQWALNHANAGDHVVLNTGIYLGPFILDHGGTSAAPITITGAGEGRPILHGLKYQKEPILTITNAPYVTLQGLEICWFQSAGIELQQSFHVSISNCVFWNEDLAKRAGRRIGTGLTAHSSEHLKIDHCLFWGMDHPFQFFNSPKFQLTYCTAAAMLHSGGRIAGSLSGSVFRNNSWTFMSNFLLAFEDNIAALSSSDFDSDFNNFAFYLSDYHWKLKAFNPDLHTPEGVLQPQAGDFFSNEQNKSMIIFVSTNMVNYFSLSEWQKQTGKDKHSICKHPQYIDPQRHDFRLLHGSPNIGAGENGTTIGAFSERK